MPVEAETLAEVNVQQSHGELWRATNFVDRLYLLYLFALSLLIVVFHFRLPHWSLYLLFHALGAAVILLLAGGARRSRVLIFLHDWYPALAFIICFEEVAALSLLVVPEWRDSYILALEARVFRTPPTVWLSRFQSRWITELVEVGYFSYFTYILIVGGALYAWRDRRPFREVMSANVLSYMLCYLWFILFPTEGPAHTLAGLHAPPLHGGPAHWAVLLIQKIAGVHGNAFPSSHVAAGVVSVIFAWRYLPRLGTWLTPLVVLLCIGAVYDHYHYFSDIIGGLVFGPVAVAMTLAWERVRGRLD